MHKADMIERLLENTIETILEEPALETLRAMLMSGFPGFERMSLTSLAQEMRLRGLLDFEEPERIDDAEFDDDEEDDDEEDEERIHLLDCAHAPR
jgi:hypothetical protein